MSKEIIVNVGERETRIAVMEEGKLVELHIERSERVVGSLYKCRVANVLPGMDASFVDIGLERNAFLAVGDVLPTGEDTLTTDSAPARNGAGTGENRRTRYERRGRRNEETETGIPVSLPVEDENSVLADVETELTDFDSLEVESINGETGDAPAEMFAGEEMQDDEMLPEAGTDFVPETAETPEAAAERMYAVSVEATELEEVSSNEDEDELDDESVDEEASVEESSETTQAALRPRRVNTRRSVLRQQRIKDVLKVGQELLVQVIKGPRSTKGARVSTRISLPGRYLVLMPEADNLGVSRKIEDAKERDRLKKIGDKLREPGFGLIIRTEAEEKTEQELRADKDFLLQTWRQVQATAASVRAPALVQQDLTLLYKTIRDVFGSDVGKLIIDDPAEYEKANALLERLSPNLKGRIHLYDSAQPIFDKFGLETEIERLLKRKVFLKSGGSLVIDETEALTVIDVNTSKFVGGSNLSETTVKTNIDAAGEIARQLRLRDIGGIIVIDFIDMSNPRDKQAVIKALELTLKKDRSRTKISNISPLGLVEMTRKRTGETLRGFMTDECPYCHGRGHLPSAESVSILLERDLRRAAGSSQPGKKDAFLVTCHPEVAELLIGAEGSTIEAIERQLQRAVYVRSDEEAHIEKFSIEPGDMAELEKNRLNYRRAQVVECRITRSLLKEAGKCIGWSEGYLLELDDGNKLIGQQAKVRIVEVRRSYAVGQVIPGTSRP